MSSGNIKQGFFVNIPSATIPQLDIRTKDTDYFNSNLSNKIETISILNQSYQKAVEIHQILNSSKDLSNTQKLDFCSLGRYFMKQYLKDVIKKLTD